MVRSGSPFSSLSSLPSGAAVGTSSVRRAAQIRARHTEVDIRDVRGNLVGDVVAAAAAVDVVVVVVAVATSTYIGKVMDNFSLGNINFFATFILGLFLVSQQEIW